MRGSQKNTRAVCSSAQMPLDACGHLLCNISVEFSGGGPRKMASHFGSASACQLTANLDRDLHAFGSYCIGHLPRESKLVENTTLDDRGLEGAFLMSDHSTPTFWIWSFKFNKPMKMCDGIFNPTYPFRDPSVLQH